MTKSDSDEFDDIEYKNYRQKRLNELNKELKKQHVVTFHNEQSLIQKSKKDKMIVHFYNDNFEKCKIMDMKLEKVCQLFKDIEFVRINASIANVFVAKLDIKILPFLGFFRDGYFVDHAVGFEGFGKDDFKVEDLCNFIRKSEIMKKN